LAADHSCGTGILSGRSFRSAQLRFQELHLPPPQVWIVEAGAEIRDAAATAPDQLWSEHIAQGWQRDQVQQALADLMPRLVLQPEGQQGPFKVSYTLQPPPDGVLEMVRQRLRQQRLEARAHLFHHWFLDVLPLRASKADAIRHLSLRWGLPLERMLVVASHADERELLNGRTLGVLLGQGVGRQELRRSAQVFFASREQAWGVLEGLDHHRFLSRCGPAASN
jgi:sucrose-phosphate synthase